jgi:hypothetical protein
MKPIPVFSQRYLRKGPLVEETYRLFSGWNDDKTVSENLDLAFLGRFPTIAWEREVRVTTAARLKNADAIRPLIVLARNGMKLDDWRDCWRLWIGATEEPLGGFVRDWLFPQMQSGRHHLRAEDVREYAINAWSGHSPGRPLSEHGVTRAARDLVHTAAQLGLLSGDGLAKVFSAIPTSDDILLFYTQMIADLEGSSSKVPGSDLWRIMMIPPSEVHVTLLHLHQFRRVDYQVAGSLVQLTLPYPSALAFAESLSR